MVNASINPRSGERATRGRRRCGRPVAQSARSWLSLAALVAVVCSAGPPRADSKAPPTLRTDVAVVVLTLDGVRWQEVFTGSDPARTPTPPGVSASELMPNLHALARDDGAALGSPSCEHFIHASGPNFVSVPGYVELLTGRPSGCKDNDCVGARSPTILDQVAMAGGSAVAVGSWPTLRRAVTQGSQHVLGSLGRHDHDSALVAHPSIAATLALGTDSSPFPGHGDFRPDRFTARTGLAALRALHPQILFLGLGETDEYGHRNDYPKYLAAMRHADSVIGAVRSELRRLESRGMRTLLVVTTDHGRADAFVHHGAAQPESSRVWLVAAGAEVTARGYLCPSEDRRLADVAATVRHVAGLAPDRTPGAGIVLTELFDRPPIAGAKLASR